MSNRHRPQRSLTTCYSSLFALVFILTACGMPAGHTSSDSNGPLSALGWAATSPSQLDHNTGMAFNPRIAVEPDGGGTAMAVWIEKKDLNLFDNKPAIYHLFAARWSGGVWGSPTLIDTGDPEANAWAPRVAMDNDGNAAVVFEQADGTDCDTAAAGIQTCSHVYARRYAAGAGWEAAPLRVDNPAGTFGAAVSPAVAMESDPGNNGGSDDGFPSMVATFTQWDGAASVQSWKSFAARTTALTGAWSAPVEVSPAGGGGEIFTVGRTTVDWLNRNTAVTNVGQFTSVVTDSTGRLYSAYYDVTNLDLRFATCDGAAVDCSAGDDAAGPKTGLGTISSSGTTVTGTGTLFTQQLRVNGTITAGGQTLTVASIANNTTLTTTAAFSPALAGGTSYAYLGSTTSGWSHWVNVCVDGRANPTCIAASATGINAGQYTGLQLDSTGRLHLVYQNASTTGVRYTTCLPASGNSYCTAVNSWTVPANLPGAAEASAYMSLAISASATAGSPGVLHAAYQGAAANLKYYACDITASGTACAASGNWTTRANIPATSPNANYISLKAGPSSTGGALGRLHLLFYDPATTKASYTTCDLTSNTDCATAANWSAVVAVDQVSANNGPFAGLAIDNGGRLHAAYQDVSGLKLRYATCAPAGGAGCAAGANAGAMATNWVGTTADPGPSNGAWAALAVDGAKRLHVVYNRAPLSSTASPAGSLKYATCDPGAGGTDCATASNWNLLVAQDSLEGAANGTGNTIGTHLSIALDPGFGVGTAYDARTAFKFIHVMAYTQVDLYLTHTQFRLTTGFTSPGGVTAVAMDSSGRATVAMVLTPVRNCSRSAPQDSIPGQHGGAGTGSAGGGNGFGGSTTGLAIDCGDDRLFVNRFTPPSSWLGPVDQTPLENLGPDQSFYDTNCEDVGNMNMDTNNIVQGSGTVGDIESSPLASPCLDIGPPGIVMDNAGNAILAFKAFQWSVTTEFRQGADSTNHGNFPLMSNQRLQIYSKTYSALTTWETDLSKYSGTVTTATTAGGTTLDDVSKGWTPGQWVGASVAILTGNGYGQRRAITANSGTQLTVTPAWTVAAPLGSMYMITLWSENLLSQFEITPYVDGANSLTAAVNASTCGTNTSGAFAVGTNPPTAAGYVTAVNDAVAAVNDSGGNYNAYIFIMNCSFGDPVLAVDPDDGASAMLSYERFGGLEADALGRRIIVVHRCLEGGGDADTACGSNVGADNHERGIPPITGTEWGYAGTFNSPVGASRDADRCTNGLNLATVGNCWGAGTEVAGPVQVDAGGTTGAFAPRLAMDNNGNAMLAWTQKDGGGAWRAYGRRFCSETRAVATASCTGTTVGWGSLLTIDGGGGLDYFEPHIAMEQGNAGNSAANCGGTTAGCGNVMAVFNAFISSANFFRVDAARWTPP